MAASTPAFGTIQHPMSGQLMGLSFRHTVSLTRTPKHAETDDQPYDTIGSWKLVKSMTASGKIRQRWMPIRSEEFELKSNGWRTHVQKDGAQKWEWEPGDKVHINWQLLTGTHGQMPRPPKSFRDTKVVTPFRYIKLGERKGDGTELEIPKTRYIITEQDTTK